MKIPQKFSSIRKEDHVTRIYVCATMWHETPEEMRDFLSSILRMDRDQCITRILQKRYRITSPDYYELESKKNSCSSPRHRKSFTFRE